MIINIDQPQKNPFDIDGIEITDGIITKTPMTALEQKLADAIALFADRNALPYNLIEFQYRIKNPLGSNPLLLDFAIPSLKIGIDIDPEFYCPMDRESWAEYECAKFAVLRDSGWDVSRLNKIDIEGDWMQEYFNTFLKNIIRHQKGRTTGL